MQVTTGLGHGLFSPARHSTGLNQVGLLSICDLSIKGVKLSAKVISHSLNCESAFLLSSAFLFQNQSIYEKLIEQEF